MINPNTRICVTNTPLEPIAAFSLVNIGRVQAGTAILDPYAGSCATLLAAAMICPHCLTVGIEISHNGMVNRDDILKDFSTRNLPLPKELIKGDSTNLDIRNQARAAIDNQPFDTIVADPPYGIRETIGHNEMSPLDEMFTYIAKDREAGTRLLKKGGRLVVFVPVTDEETLSELLPSPELSQQAGLKFEVSKEQVLNEKLSRWLVSFVCVR
jgi:tRNA G10  N-methylase Trm11